MAMRPLAIELAFDADSQRRLNRLWSDLADLYGGPSGDELGVCPHVTLALFRDREPGDLLPVVAALASELAPFELQLSTVDQFHTAEGAVFLRPSASRELSGAHTALQELLGSNRDLVDPYYRPSAWQPHCTLAVTVRESLISAVIAAALAGDAVGPVRVERLQMVRYYPATEIWSTKLEPRV